MPLVKLFLVIVLTASPLGVWAETEEVAEKRSGASTPRRLGLTLDASPARAMARELVAVAGSVGTAVRRPVTLQRERAHGWQPVESTTSTKRGRYTFEIRTPKRPTALTFRTVAAATRQDGRRLVTLTSKPLTIRPVAQTGSLQAPAESAINRDWTLAATFTPARLGRTVKFQEHSTDGWRTVGRAEQDAEGVASATMVGITEGEFTYRAVATRFHGARSVRTAPGTVRVAPDATAVADVAEPLGQAESEAITSIDLAAGVLRFGPDAPPSVGHIAVGDVVTVPPMTGAPSGALLEVVEVTVHGAGRVLRTRPAALPDVVLNVPDDQTEIAMPLAGPVEVEPLTEVTGGFAVEDVDGASLRAAELPRARRNGLGAASIDGPAKKISFSHTFKEQQGDVTSKVLVEGSISLAPVVDFAFDADWGGVKSYQLGAGFKVTDKLRAAGSVTWSKQWRKELFRVTSVHAGAIGPIPVYVVTTGTVDIVVGVAGQVSAEYTWNRTGEAVVGIQGTKATGLFTPKPYHRTPVTAAELLVGNVAGALTAGVVGTGRFDIYSIAGTYAELGYEAVLTISDHSEQGLACTLQHRPLAAVGLSTGDVVKMFTGTKYELARHQFSFAYKTISLCPAAPPSPPDDPTSPDDPTPAGQPVITTTELPDAIIGEPYDEQLTVEDGRAGTWAIVQGELPGGLTLDPATGRIAGMPPAEDSTLFTVRFTDNQGRTATTDIVLYVVPDSEPAGSGWTSVNGEGYVTCGVREDGSGWCWGDNNYGQLGDGTTMMRLTPTRVPGSWKEIRTSGKTTCGVQTDGTGWCWGLNRYGSVGIGAPAGGDPVDQHSPAKLSGSWRQIVPGSSEATCGIRIDDSGWCWGSSAYGALGIGDSNRRDVPTQVAGSWRTIEPGDQPTTCGIRVDATGWCWGFNAMGQIGDGTNVHRDSPTQVSGSWKSLKQGRNTTCGVRLDATGWCWGENSRGQVGDGTTVDKYVPVALPGTWDAISPDHDGTCGVRSDSTGWCWGANNYGEIGDGTRWEHRLSPAQVPGTWRTVERNGWLTCGTGVDGAGSCWGRLAAIETDNGAEIRVSPSPNPLSGRWAGISIHDGTACGIQDDRTGWCWGYNGGGGVGDGTTTDRLAPFMLP